MKYFQEPVLHGYYQTDPIVTFPTHSKSRRPLHRSIPVIKVCCRERAEDPRQRMLFVTRLGSTDDEGKMTSQKARGRHQRERERVIFRAGTDTGVDYRK